MLRHTRGSWEAERVKNLTTVKTAPPARAPFWAWPNNVLRLCVAQARGLLSVYKNRGASLYPFSQCTGSQSRAHGHTKQNEGGEPR